jgi:hypothetical protein
VGTRDYRVPLKSLAIIGFLAIFRYAPNGYFMQPVRRVDPNDVERLATTPFDAEKVWAPRGTVSFVEETMESMGPRVSRSWSQ